MRSSTLLPVGRLSVSFNCTLCRAAISIRRRGPALAVRGMQSCTIICTSNGLRKCLGSDDGDLGAGLPVNVRGLDVCARGVKHVACNPRVLSGSGNVCNDVALKGASLRN